MAVSRDPQFRTVRMREGYDLDEVDDFVDRVLDALEGRGRAISPQQVEAEEFKVVRMREGYAMDDVDDWLDAAAAELRKLRKSGHQGPSGPQTPPPPSYPAAAPVAPPPAAAPVPGGGYQGYQQGYSDTGHGASYGTSHGTSPGFDPMSDSGVYEIDPALRALDQTYQQSQAQPPQPPQPPQPQFAMPPQAADPQSGEQALADSATPATGLHHLEIWTRDLELASASFGWLFERLGWTLFQVWDNGRSWQAPGGGPYIVVERSPDLTWSPYDRKAPGLNHLALAVPERWMVDKVVSESSSYGWHLMFADRHPYAGGPHHYAAYMENDEGFEVEVVAP